jgi:predicted ATPase
MVYLEKFIFPDLESDTINDGKGHFFNNTYPFHLTSNMELWSLDFEPITILFGGNGSGKSTILNVIAQKLYANRLSMFNTSYCFDKYVDICQYRASKSLAGETIYNGHRELQKYDISKITTVLTSDDIFHMMQEHRLENDRKLQKSRFLKDDYYNPESLPRHLNLETGYNVERYIKGVEARNAKSFSKYLQQSLGEIERGFSNGETALMKLNEVLNKPGLYLLDEPENSMSCEFQMKLKAIIEYLARHGNCQFVISTHSPFLLSMENAKIYNLDHIPVSVCKWWELESMRHYYQLFEGVKEHFEK